MGKKKLTDEQKEYIREHWQNERICEIAKALGIDRRAVRSFGVRHVGAKEIVFERSIITDEHRAFVSENIGKMTKSAMAKELGMSATTVSRIVTQLGLVGEKLSPYKIHFKGRDDAETEKLVKKICEIFEDTPSVEIAEKFGLDVEQVRYIGKKFGLKKNVGCRLKVSKKISDTKRKNNGHRELTDDEFLDGKERKEMIYAETGVCSPPKCIVEAEPKPTRKKRSDEHVRDVSVVESKEPCIKEKCVGYRICKRFDRKRQFCDAYMYTHC